MTALTAAKPPAIRPVPWRRLGWVAWRRYRTTLLATVGVLGLVAIYLFITGDHIHTAYDTLRSCTPKRSARCNFEFTNFQNAIGSTGLLGFVQVLAPGLVGAFAGAPLLARELETGTFRYAWTQGVGRMRWALSLLAPALVGSAALMAAFGSLVAWRNQPSIKAGVGSRMDGSLFPAVPPAVIGWTLLAFALGVLAGLLWRRVLPAVVTTIVVWFGVAVLASLTLRSHYMPPATTTKLQINSADLTVAQWWTKGGHRVGITQLNQVLQAAGLQGLSSGHSQVAAPGSGGTSIDPVHYLLQHGYIHLTSYQPASRYGSFQWIEFGWLTTLAILLLAASVFVLRRRDA